MTDLPAAPAPPDVAPPDAGDHAYFLAIEDVFVRLRGAPLLLSPADWQAARRWHRQGVPLEVVREALEEVFARRRERGAKGRISSLRYCGPAVEAAWLRRSELTAPGERAAAELFDAAARLRCLAAALPSQVPGAADLRARLVGIVDDDPQAIEERLADLDRQALDGAWAALDEEDRRVLAGKVDGALAGLASRLPAAEVESARMRLARQVLRDRLGLPVLSLFSPEALDREPPPAAPEEAPRGPRGGADVP
jgi:hypothetical protein